LEVISPPATVPEHPGKLTTGAIECRGTSLGHREWRIAGMQLQHLVRTELYSQVIEYQCGRTLRLSHGEIVGCALNDMEV
jgi:hypothetical protein